MSRFFSGSVEPFWPHAVLLTIAIVASFAVAAGIVLENPKWSLANVLVVGGVAIEAVCTLLLFGFDEGISGAQQSKIEAQQSTIIALEKRIAPRDLTPEQQDRIVETLKQFGSIPFDLAMHPQIEPMRLTDEIEDLLLRAGWQEVPADPNSERFARLNRSPVGIRDVAAVWVIYPKSESDKFWLPALALSEGLNIEGVESLLYGNVNSAAKPYDQGKIHIWVGEKP